MTRCRGSRIRHAEPGSGAARDAGPLPDPPCAALQCAPGAARASLPAQCAAARAGMRTGIEMKPWTKLDFVRTGVPVTSITG